MSDERVLEPGLSFEDAYGDKIILIRSKMTENGEELWLIKDHLTQRLRWASASRLWRMIFETQEESTKNCNPHINYSV